MVTSNHQINSTDITKAFIMIIQLKHSPQLSSKLELNLQTTVWGWVVGPWSVITGPVGLAINYQSVLFQATRPISEASKKEKKRNK